MTPTPLCEPTELDRRLEEFEAAQRRDGEADLARFLPAPDHAEYATVLRELVRVDLEYGWTRGRPAPVEAYFARFPALAADPEGRRLIVFEEYRQRREAGETPDPSEYVQRYGIHPLGEDSSCRPSVAQTPASDGTSAIFGAPRDGDPFAIPTALITPVVTGGARTRKADSPLGSGESGSDSSDPRLPEVGEEFLGFRLIGELGRGGFGRVYLAKQGRLAERLVALKVSAEMFQESQTLAQLQHTNIVPIYSVHQAGPLQAVCMPYFGGTTLEDVLKGLRGRTPPRSGRHFLSTLQDRRNSTRTGASSSAGSAPTGQPQSESPAAVAAEPGDPIAPPAAVGVAATAALEMFQHSSYVGAVLWLGARLAAGLAHAHERGVIHRDLKPANVLLTDDGQPMLLDFNLAADGGAQSKGGAAAARVGGTLPYMAPEQLRAFRGGPASAVDGRSDLYALGLILFELLTGRPAFPVRTGKGHEVIDKMLAERVIRAPALTRFNTGVTPAVEAMIARCLHPDPAMRYQTVRDFQEDVERHLAHLPLKHTAEPSWRERAGKWAARHPQLTSATTIMAIAAVVMLMFGTAAVFWQGRAEKLEAYKLLDDFAAAVDRNAPGLIHAPDARADTPAEMARFLAKAQQPVAAYHVASDPNWQSAAVVTRLAGDDRQTLRQRMAEYLLLLAQRLIEEPARGDDRLRDALVYNDRAGDLFASDTRPRLWTEQRIGLLERLGQATDAAKLREQLVNVRPQSAQDYYLEGLNLHRKGQLTDALWPLKEAVLADPKHFRAHFLLGNCYSQLRRYPEADACYSTCIALDPRHPKVRFTHGMVLYRIGQFGPAYEELRRALELDPKFTQARIERAMVAVRLNKYEEAEDELTAVLTLADAPTYAYYRRAQVRDRLGKKAEAEADRKELLRRDPADEISWVTRGWARLKSDPEGALNDFRQAEELNPASYFALENQAHVLGELKRHEESLKASEKLVTLYPQDPKALAGRAIELARLGRADEAVRDAEACLNLHPAPLDRYQIAGVYALTKDRPGHAAKAIHLVAESLLEGAGWTELPTDPDLVPLADHADFRRLQEAARTLHELIGKP
jgi:serine/threonine protein kinase/tetratricopeptide (TPR) repeat protein